MERNKMSTLVIVIAILYALVFAYGMLSIINTDSNVIEKTEKNSENIATNLETSSYEWFVTEYVSNESTGNSYRPSLAIDGLGNIHVAWHDVTDDDGQGDTDIYYKFWNATSGAWNTTAYVSTESTGNSNCPSLAIDGLGNIHVAWHDATDDDGQGDSDIYYKFWNATSGAWNTTAYVSTESTGDSNIPSLAVDSSGNVHIAWEDFTNHDGEGDWDIYYKFWNATSGAWNTTAYVSTESTLGSKDPSLAVDSFGNVHIAWDDNTNDDGQGDLDIYYKFWNATSGAWQTREYVSTESTGSAVQPSLAVDGLGNIHVAWEDNTDDDGQGDTDIYYKFWNATSGAWLTREYVSTESTGASYVPSLAVDGLGNIDVAWSDATDDDGETDYDIYFKRRNCIWEKWTKTEFISTESTGDSTYASLAIDGLGNIHVAWQDATDDDGQGDTDIYYQLGILGSGDRDGDGLTDFDELYVYGTDPYKFDTDCDNLHDGFELKYGTDPLDDDSDDDGYYDGVEVMLGTNPLDPSDFPGKTTPGALPADDDDDDDDKADDEFPLGMTIIIGLSIVIGSGVGTIILIKHLKRKKRL
jgi:hypothetical protein